MDNKKNLQFFEADSMSDLYATMTAWQDQHEKRLLSMNIQREDNGKYCCIALTNPSEVVIVAPDDGSGEFGMIGRYGSCLRTY